jgi:hypothetical protein
VQLPQSPNFLAVFPINPGHENLGIAMVVPEILHRGTRQNCGLFLLTRPWAATEETEGDHGRKLAELAGTRSSLG